MVRGFALKRTQRFICHIYIFKNERFIFKKKEKRCSAASGRCKWTLRDRGAHPLCAAAAAAALSTQLAGGPTLLLLHRRRREGPRHGGPSGLSVTRRGFPDRRAAASLTLPCTHINVHGLIYIVWYIRQYTIY